MIKQFQDEYRWLSNFWPCNVFYDHVLYPTVENAYQAAKFPVENRQIFTYCSPFQAKKISHKAILSPDWHTKKIIIMFELLLQKYHKEPFSGWLLATGTQLIQEGNYHGDDFWGIDLKKGSGNNLLGIMIMCIRDELREQYNEGL